MLSPRSHDKLLTALLITGLALFLPAAMMAEGDIPRTATGRPDLSGSYNAATLTPLERPAVYGDKLFMTRAEAEKIAADQAAFLDNALRDTDPNREAPPVGGAQQDAGLGIRYSVLGFRRSDFEIKCNM